MLWAVVLCFAVNAQEETQTATPTYELGSINFPPVSGIASKYIYDPTTDRYLYSESIDGYNIGIPLVLTTKEFEELQLKETVKDYLKEKVATLSGKGANLEDLQKDLLPEVYVNNDFFQSIFGSNKIDIQPQGSISIDMGMRYQRTDNPIVSPRNRSSFGFEFDQRISLSLLGQIGERLQITANYDTESTFDFQNIVKVQFNPPTLQDAVNIAPGGLNDRIQGLQQLGADPQSLLNNPLEGGVSSLQESAIAKASDLIPGKLDGMVDGLLDTVENAKKKASELQEKQQQYQNTLQQTQQKIDGLKSKQDAFLSNPGFGGVNDKVANYLEGGVSEDAILQNIDIGNISMPVNSALMQGAQSLFGVRTDLKFGNTFITGVFSEQRSQSQVITVQGGGTFNEFDVFALDYEENQHFFLGQYFRNQYDFALTTFPYINSAVQITRIEVWVTNRGSRTENIRNIVALQDLGETEAEDTRLGGVVQNFFTTTTPGVPPTNEANGLNPEAIAMGGILNDNIRDIANVKSGFGSLAPLVSEGIDYAVLESARKLRTNEFTFHPQLGYISLNQKLNNDEVLGVAFQFTYLGSVYQVGEFANSDVPGTQVVSNTSTQGTPLVENQSLVVKLLKSNLTDVRQPVWDLMMKNIYNTGAFQLSEEDFRLSILYADPSPINYISPEDSSVWPEDLEQQILLNTFGLDRLNAYQDATPKGDGFFDFIPEITIKPESGRIIFPKVEPFGSFLFTLLDDPASAVETYETESSYNANQRKYVFREMYALTKAAALEITEKNKFQMKGRYKTLGNDGISIGAFNVPRGSVRVTAGGRVLQEDLDYTVNYDIGRLRILDEGLKASNVPIQISAENNSFFNQQNKRFAGINVDHKVNDQMFIGGTFLNLSENPLTQKANYGTEPVNNTMVGFRMNFSTEVPFLTHLINKIPTIDTDVPSQLSFNGEVAQLVARNPVNTTLDGETNVYIDDFEGAQTNLNMKGFTAWSLASVPAKNFEAESTSDSELGKRRGKLAWYSIDPVFYTPSRPAGIDNSDVSLNTTRRIFISEIFPEQDLVQGTTTVQTTLDLAYYPNEKGPYNKATNAEFAQDRETHWGGIMRAINTTNFEQSNVEFIEFWLLDTFSETVGGEEDLGELTFHLGNISEDILKDGRKQFENGLPGATDNSPVYTTPWGKVPSSQSLVYAFNTITEDRLVQDVGLDGLTDAEEQEVYPDGFPQDPAGDNYQYFIAAEGGVLERYKNYNGMDGNSPISFSNTDRGNTNNPDTEDINRDQSMNTIDSYFEYRVPIARNMTVGNHPFITDVRENVNVQVPDGSEITTRWIQFKIPISKEYYENTSFQEYFEAINSIEDLRSIRFMRMLLKGFEQPTVLRFGTLDLVRGDWRRYIKPLNEDVVANNNTTVDITTVNILENENRIPVNYVLPPGIQREQINNNNTIVRQNEQSLAFRICDLQPMDARGIFKNVDLDLRQYKKLRMFLHAESIPGQTPLPGEGTLEEYDRRLVAFIRLGTDYTDNYYQIEVPLKPTDYATDGSNQLSAEAVWIPESNAIEIPVTLLSKLKALTLERMNFTEAVYFDEELNRIDEFAPISSLPGFKKYKLSIKGNPSLASVRSLMIGVKNPSTLLGDALCGEVWFNELRISGIDNKSGWAAIGTLDTNIADFATVSASGRMSTVGFGTLGESPNQRSREDMTEYDFVSDMNLGQLAPQKWGLQVPLNYAFGETQFTPEFDPFYEDLKLEERLNVAERQSQKDSIKHQAVDYTRRKSVNLIGVRKNKTGSAKTRFYSPENFNFSYAYNELLHRDYEIENQKELNLMLGVNYGYSFQTVEVRPFKKVSSLNGKKYWQWLKEINLSLLPKTVAFTSNINRMFSSQKFREVYTEGIDASQQLALPELRQRNYLFDWSYTHNHDLTRSLKLNFTASGNNIVRNFSEDDTAGTNANNREIWRSLWNTGEPNQYFQRLTLNYSLPLRYIPFLSFIDAKYNYDSDFNWQRGPEAFSAVVSEEGTPLGQVNTVQNSNLKTITGAIAFDRLYTILGVKSKKDRKRAASRPVRKAPNDTLKKRKNNKALKNALGSMVDVLSKIKRVQVNYSENNGTVLPGYLPSVGFAGQLSPMLGFAFGSQADIRYEAAKRGWLTTFPNFNQQVQRMHDSRLKFSSQLVVSKDFVIDFNAERNFSETTAENFLISGEDYFPQNVNTFGNFGMSTILIKTAFEKRTGILNPNFERFRDYRLIVAEKLAAENGFDLNNRDEDGFPAGYGKNQQAVVLHAFLAAYQGTSAEKVSLDPIQKTPLPNWGLKYTGLTKLKPLAAIFNRFSLTHAYRASYSLLNFQSNFDYDSQIPLQKDAAGNVIPERIYGNINLVEQFNPLVRLDVEFKNAFKILAEMRRDRSLTLSLDNNLLTEVTGNEYIVGLGFRVPDLRFVTNVGGRRTTLKGDLNLKADVSYRTNLTVLRNLEYDNNQVTAGQKLLSIKVGADYALSRNLTALFYYDHNFSKFEVSTAFPQTGIRSGITIRYNFGN